MVQYSKALREYEGKTLKQAGITLDTNGPRNRLNILT
jgi:pyruvate kinase